MNPDSRKKLQSFTLAAGIGICLAVSANPLRAPDDNTIAEARALVESMKKSPRGPYKQIRWHCNDGSVFPPVPYACKDHGGGKQHAEYSDGRERLAALGWSTGTIITALSWDEFWDGDNNYRRMRELALEKYLVDIDDGWVLQRARHYRGRVQIEDEEYSGRELLLQLAEQQDWLAENYLLMRELVRTIPHGSGNDLTRDIRRISQNIAEQVPGFENLRVEIHSTPSADTLVRLHEWIRQYGSDPEHEPVLALANELVEKLDQLYGPRGRQQRLNQIRIAISKYQALAELHTLLDTEDDGSDFTKAERLALLLAEIRNAIQTQISAIKRLELLDGITDIEAELRLTASTVLLQQDLSRLELLKLAQLLAMSAYGGGYLSLHEKNTISSTLEPILESESIAYDTYQTIIDTLNRTSAWALGTVRYTFAEPLVRYTALEPAAAAFVDDLLRGSTLLQLAQAVRRLGFDAQSLGHVQKRMFGEPASAMMALNPGIATGPLYIASEQEAQEGLRVSRDNIVVLPRTVSELPPVAGILTVGESNMLSHVQLLARNFGIPNVAVTQTLLDNMKPYHGKQVVLAAASDGSVIVSTLEQLSGAQQQLFGGQSGTDQTRLTAPVPNLDLVHPLTIDEIDITMSGKVVGPKAANLSKLYKLFPGKVAPAIALPFGLFYRQVNQRDETNWHQLQTIYNDYRTGKINAGELDARLTQLREAVSAIRPDGSLQAEMITLMQQWFGEPGSYGVFVRSDTNVEDLPGFTGAGLSETLPHIVGMENLFNAIPRVWASVLAPRAIAWRSNLLTNPEHVYPSVLLMKSVAVEKSGVLVTSDLHHRTPGLTVSMAWGVGGAVGGEATETLLLKPDGSEVLLSEAKTPYQRVLQDTGGIAWKPALAGAILTADEKQQLRNIAVKITEQYGLAHDDEGNVLPWDIEFGFDEGALQLFQIRPLIERGKGVAERFINQVAMPGNEPVTSLVDLTAIPIEAP